MFRRLLLVALLFVGLSTSLFASVRPCMKASDGCGQHGGSSAGVGSPVWDPVGGVNECHPSGGDPSEPYRNRDVGPLGVVLSTGEFQITVTDLEIPGRGFPFRLTRTYRSKRDVEDSSLGYNWHLSYDEYLTPGTLTDCYGIQHPAIEWMMGNGFKDKWVEWDVEIGFVAFSGFFGRIRSLGTDAGFQIRYPDGTVKTFAREEVVNGYPAWMLTRIEDRNGNVMTFQFYTSGQGDGHISTVTDTLGRAITFVYGSGARLTSVTDFYQRRVDYDYDGDHDLDWVKAPEVTGTPTGNDFSGTQRKQTSYTYLGTTGCADATLTHNLAKIIDGKGQTFLKNTYFHYGDTSCGIPVTTTATNDHVANQVYGDPGLGQTVSYAYAALRTTITDRNGNIQLHDFNSQGNPLRVEYQTNQGIRTLAGADEINYVETWTYVDPGDGTRPELVSRHTEPGGFNVDASGSLVSYAGGMSIQYIYVSTADPFQKGNLQEVQRTPGPRDVGSSVLTTFYTYEPLFNQPVTATDSRGHVTRYTYDYQEGDYTQLVAGTPAPVNPDWWGGVTPFVAQPEDHWDINGDLYHRGGNLIRVSEGQPTGYDGTPGAEITTTVAYNDCGLPTIRRDAEFNETHFFYFPENMPDGATSTTLPTPDSRTLRGTGGTSGITDATGCGYLRLKVLDATPTMLLSTRPPGPDREDGQTPPVQNINLSFKYDPVGNVKQATDGRGIQTDYWVNTLNQIVQITHASVSTAPGAPALSYLEQFFYDANNNVTQHRTERRENCTPAAPETTCWTTQTFVYDWLDRKKSETVSTSDPTSISLTTSYDYDANGNLIQTVFPAGNVVLKKYDERDLLYEEAALKTCTGSTCNTYSSAVDSVTRYDYDGSGNVIQLTDPEGHTAKTGYDGYNRKIVGFDPALQKTTFAYDTGGNLVEQVSFGSLGGVTPTGPPYRELSHQKFFYDELSRLRRTDTKFFKDDGTTITLLPSGLKGGLTGSPPDGLPADGWVTSLLKYDRLGRVTKATDNNAHFTETRYDGLGKKLQVALNPVAPLIYTPGGTDQRNAVSYVYDQNNNLACTLETEWGVDRNDPANPRTLTAQRYRTDFKYDSMNRLVETKVVGRLASPSDDCTTSFSGLNYKTTVVYDSRGNKVQVTDPVGGRTKFTYDGLNRLKTSESGYLVNGAVDDPPANMKVGGNTDGLITTVYDYDNNSRLTSIKDDNLRITSFSYDNLNRQTRITYPDDSHKEITTYDRDSLARVWTHCKIADCSTDKLIVSTLFDVLHRPIQKDVDSSHATYFIGTKRQSFEYDGAGRMTRAVDDLDPADAVLTSEVKLAYNSLGKVLTEEQSYGEPAAGILMKTNSVTSDYNGVGFRTQVNYPGGARTVSFAPDELNRLNTLTDSFTGVTRYDYLGPSRVLNRVYPNTTKLTMLSNSSDNVVAGYDDARRVVDWASKTTAATPVVLSEFGYGYDAANNRLFERRVHQPNTPNWKGERYTYDAVYRLTNRSEGNLNASGVLQSATTTQDFTLDGLGNWKGHAKDGTGYTNTVNTLNQYSQFVGPQGTENLTYDFEGNMTSDTVVGSNPTSYAYDFANRLVTFQLPSNLVTTYRYDALGRRISKNIGGTNLTRFVYDGDRLIEERDSTNALVASYVYGIGSNEVLTRRRGPDSSWDLFYHTNAMGSVTAVTDTNGAIVERYQYDAYGAPTFLAPNFAPQTCGVSTCSTVSNTILFTGQYYDTGSKNYYYRARYYSPYLGRFLQRDPLGESVSLNLYAYVSDNPVNDSDPGGMMSGMMASVRGIAEQEMQYDQWRQGWEADMNSAADQAMSQFHGYNAMENTVASARAFLASPPSGAAAHDEGKVSKSGVADPKHMKVDGPVKQELLDQMSNAVGLPVSVNANGEVEVAPGPPAPDKQAAYAAFMAASAAGVTLHAVSADAAPVGTVGDHYASSTVVPDHIAQFASTPPSESPNAVTQGELITHILTEQAAKANGLDYSAAHAMGVDAENDYRAQNGQSRVIPAYFPDLGLFRRVDSIKYMEPGSIFSPVTHIMVINGRAEVWNRRDR